MFVKAILVSLIDSLSESPCVRARPDCLEDLELEMIPVPMLRVTGGLLFLLGESSGPCSLEILNQREVEPSLMRWRWYKFMWAGGANFTRYGYQSWLSTVMKRFSMESLLLKI